MEYKTADGRVVDDELLAQEVETFERGERPDVWQASDSQPGNVTPSNQVITETDA